MDRNNSLKIYLIKRFLFIIACTAVSEMIINTLYYNVVFPLMREYLHINEVFGAAGVTGAFTDITLLLFRMFLGYVVSFGFVERYLPFLSRVLERYIDVPEFNTSVVIGGSELYSIAVFIILAFLWLVLIVPYVIAAISFIRIVIAKIDKPIKQITGGMEQVTAGNLEVRLSFETEHEFVKMRDAFNIMAENIEEDERRKKEYELNRNMLFADIAHDLKTPITTISGYAKALSDGMVTDEAKRQEYFSSIYEKSLKVDELITLLFEYSKLNSDEFQLKKEKLDIAELLRENAARMYLDFESKEINLEVEIPEDIIYVDADRVQISRVITNLLNNALKHNKSGTNVLAGLCLEKDTIEIKIADDGDLIDPKIAEHIFEPFVVGDESRSSHGGSGLGLSIASKIVSMHDGILSLEQYEDQRYTKAFVISLQKI